MPSTYQPHHLTAKPKKLTFQLNQCFLYFLLQTGLRGTIDRSVGQVYDVSVDVDGQLV